MEHQSSGSNVQERKLTIIPGRRVVSGEGRPNFKWQVQFRQSSRPLHLGDRLSGAEKKPHQSQSSTVLSSVPALFLFSAISILKKHVQRANTPSRIFKTKTTQAHFNIIDKNLTRLGKKTYEFIFCDICVCPHRLTCTSTHIRGQPLDPTTFDGK